MQAIQLKPGDAARVRQNIHSPYSGKVGVVMNIDADDERAPYLVMFSDGLQFRYLPTEVEALEKSSHRSVLESVLRVIGDTRHSLFRPRAVSPEAPTLQGDSTAEK